MNIISKVEGDTFISDVYGTTHTFTIVNKIPKRYSIWFIGPWNMGSEEYVPFCEPLNEYDPYRIDPDTLLTIKFVRAEALLLYKVSQCGGTIEELQEVLGHEDEYFNSWALREEIELAIKILKRVTEDK